MRNNSIEFLKNKWGNLKEKQMKKNKEMKVIKRKSRKRKKKLIMKMLRK